MLEESQNPFFAFVLFGVHGQAYLIHLSVDQSDNREKKMDTCTVLFQLQGTYLEF